MIFIDISRLFLVSISCLKVFREYINIRRIWKLIDTSHVFLIPSIQVLFNSLYISFFDSYKELKINHYLHFYLFNITSTTPVYPLLSTVYLENNIRTIIYLVIIRGGQHLNRQSKRGRCIVRKLRDIVRSLLNLQDGNNVGVPLRTNDPPCISKFPIISATYIGEYIRRLYIIGGKPVTGQRILSPSLLHSPSLFLFRHNGALQPSNLTIQTPPPLALCCANLSIS